MSDWRIHRYGNLEVRTVQVMAVPAKGRNDRAGGGRMSYNSPPTQALGYSPQGKEERKKGLKL
jgi:hypothetical protein